jgi:hypothetical protein
LLLEKGIFLEVSNRYGKICKKPPEYWPTPRLTVSNVFLWPCGNPAFWLKYNVRPILGGLHLIIEQAFLQLPEILHGSGYQQQDYEAGIVGALSLSVLQVLNGHNTANPISCLQHERLFRKGGNYQGLPDPRYFRADLYVNIGKLFVANKRLAQYGWRHNAWLEAKFLRNQTANGTKHSGNKSIHVANFLADIIRLSILVPEDKGESSNGRYFLHVYDSDPKWYLTFGNRAWLRSLCRPGNQQIVLENLDSMPPTIKRFLGEFPGLSIKLGITNMTLTTLVADNPPCYWMYLTRIDSIGAELNDHRFELRSDRTIGKSTDHALDEIASSVASLLHIDPKSVESAPPVELGDEEKEEMTEQEAPADG